MTGRVRSGRSVWVRTCKCQREDSCADVLVLDRDPSVGCHIDIITHRALNIVRFLIIHRSVDVWLVDPLPRGRQEPEA